MIVLAKNLPRNLTGLSDDLKDKIRLAHDRGQVRPDLQLRERLLDRAFKEMDRRNISVKEQYEWLQNNCPQALLPPISGKSASTYIVCNSTATSTAAPVSQPTGSAIRTMLQICPAATSVIRVVEWGISFDGSAAVTPGKVELFGNTVAATMSTAFAAADVMPHGNANAPANTAGSSGVPLNLSTATSGFATAAVTEGTVANYRLGDLQLLPPTGPYVKQFPLGREFEVLAGQFMRVRVTFGATVNAYIYIIFEV